MAYHSKYSGAEVDSLLDKIKADDVGSIDSSLSTTSENPVQNKVITEELNKKANKTDIATINGKPLTNGGNIEVVTDSYDDTEIKGKLTELDSQIEAEATARTAADAELQTQINGKQEALTLTVKDNGNIVLANIQGQSKEFMPATPSGDPMHYAYVAAGAEYNNTGADIVRTTPWADMLDDDYTGDYGNTVIHKAGYWYLNGLGDITNEEIRKIYQLTSNFPPSTELFGYFRLYKNRTNFSANIRSGWGTYSLNGLCDGSTIEILNLTTLEVSLLNVSSTTFYQVICVLGSIMTKQVLIGGKSLMSVKIKNLTNTANFKKSSKLSVKSVLYMINNEAATAPITITLHADVYNKCMANVDILAALESHPQVSLASA